MTPTPDPAAAPFPPTGPVALFTDDVPAWTQALRDALPGAGPVVAWPAHAPDARVAFAWEPTQAFIDAHPDLRLLLNLGAGVDGLQRLRLPPGLRVVRIEDGGMGQQLAEYVVHAVVRHFREFDAYAASAGARQWNPRQPRERDQFPVGVMGLGALGIRVARAVASFGFPVLGWSRTPHAFDGIECHSGPDGLQRFLRGTRILVCMLPLTPHTDGLLDRATLSTLRRGAYLVNPGRGRIVVQPDLIALLNEGALSGAMLDVTATEPLPADDPLWKAPGVTITPHVAGQTERRAAAFELAGKLAQYLRDPSALDDGRITGVVDPARGY